MAIGININFYPQAKKLIMAKLIQADTTIFYIFLSKCKCEAFVDLILTIHPMIPIRTIWIISLNKISIQ